MTDKGNEISSTYECAACLGTFEKGWTDDEAQAESMEKFGYVDESFAVICDDCFKIGEAREAERQKKREQRSAEYQAKLDALSPEAKRVLDIVKRAMVQDYANYILYGEGRKPSGESRKPKDE